MEQHSRQRIHSVGIVTAGDDNQIRFKTRQRRQHDRFQRIAPAVVPCAGHQRNVNVVTFAGTGAAIFLSGIARWETAVLVQRDCQHIVTMQVDMLRTVAVVHIPVEDRHFTQPEPRLRPLHGNGNVGKKTEAHRLIRQAVVARRPRQRVGIIQLAAQHRLNRGTGQPGRKAGNFIAARPQRRLFAQQTAAAIADRLKALQIMCRVNAAQILLAGGRAAA